MLACGSTVVVVVVVVTGSGVVVVVVVGISFGGKGDNKSRTCDKS